MIKVFLFMYICSTIPGNDCRVVPTKKEQFNDIYECTIYGYQESLDLIYRLDREFVNQQGAHTKFICQEQEII